MARSCCQCYAETHDIEADVLGREWGSDQSELKQDDSEQDDFERDNFEQDDFE